MKEKTEQKEADAWYKPDSAKAKITQFDGPESRIQVGFDLIVRRTGRLMAGIHRV